MKKISQLNVRLPDELIKDIKILVLENDSTVSSIVYELLLSAIVLNNNTEYLKDHTAFSKLILSYNSELIERGILNDRN